MEGFAIEFQGLSKRYGEVLALDSLTLSVNRGEVFGFLGPNGAGKTTAIRILFDLVRPTSGSARLLGLDCQREGTLARAEAGYLPGDLSLYDQMTGEEIFNLFASLRPGRALDRAFLRRLIERLDLDPTRKAATYSKGNKQKIGLVLAVMQRPSVLVLDEPTSGLDPLVQEEVARLLRELAEEGHTVFFSSHVLSEVERMCHRAAIIRHGRLAAVEDVAELKGRSLHIIEVTFAQEVAPEEFALDGVRVLRRDGATFHLEVQSNLDAAVKAISQHTVVDLRTEQPGLEDIFLAYYQDAPAPRETSGVA